MPDNCPRVQANQHPYSFLPHPTGPTLIKPDDPDPIGHRYPLRSHCNQLNLAQHETCCLLPLSHEANGMDDAVTGNVQEY